MTTMTTLYFAYVLLRETIFHLCVDDKMRFDSNYTQKLIVDLRSSILTPQSTLEKALME